MNSCLYIWLLPTHGKTFFRKSPRIREYPQKRDFSQRIKSSTTDLITFRVFVNPIFLFRASILVLLFFVDILRCIKVLLTLLVWKPKN
jgi:hypothetical protein